MIGAMPAVAVRHQRGTKNQMDKSNRLTRPRTPSLDHRTGALLTDITDETPSCQLTGTASTRDRDKDMEAELPQPCSCDCGILCGRISLLHFTVICVLLGVTLLVVGVVQLAPDATMGAHKYVIIGSGVCLLALGTIFLVGMCLFQKKYQQNHLLSPQQINDEPVVGDGAATCTTVSNCSNHVVNNSAETAGNQQNADEL